MIDVPVKYLWQKGEDPWDQTALHFPPSRPAGWPIPAVGDILHIPGDSRHVARVVGRGWDYAPTYKGMPPRVTLILTPVPLER